MKSWFVLLLVMVSAAAHSQFNDTPNVKVKQLLLEAEGGLFLQTEPRHNIDGLGCQSNAWLSLDVQSPGFEALLSLLMTAQVAQQPISVRVAEDDGADLCRLIHVSMAQE